MYLQVLILLQDKEEDDCEVKSTRDHSFEVAIGNELPLESKGIPGIYSRSVEEPKTMRLFIL